MAAVPRRSPAGILGPARPGPAAAPRAAPGAAPPGPARPRTARPGPARLSHPGLLRGAGRAGGERRGTARPHTPL